MKTLNSIYRIKLLRIFLVAVMIIVFFVGLSYIGSDKNNPAKIQVDTQGYNMAYADSVGWGGVRIVATMIRAVNISLNTIFANIKAWGLLFDYTISVDGMVPGTSYYASVRINNSQSNVKGTVDVAPGVAYTNRIQLKDVNSSGPVIYQLFFNNPNDSADATGCLVIIKPYYFEVVRGTLFDQNGVFEARVKSSGLNKIMYISFNGNPWKNNAPSYVKSGRVKLVDDGTNYNITGLAFVNVDGSDILHQACPLQIIAPFTAGDAYYTLAYIAVKNSPYYSTALWGWNNTLKSNQICSITNIYNYGHFNASSGYVCDGSPSTGCPDASPYPLTTDVLTLYNSIDTTTPLTEFRESDISGLAIPFLTFN
jgi:hypothetical protein